MEDILMLVRQQRYFVLHAPRQTGKTSCMLALRDYLNQKGDYISVYANVEGGQASRNDKETVVKSTVDTLTGEMRLIMKNDKADKACEHVQKVGTDSMLSQFLSILCQSLDKPLVLIIDEIDALVGDSLVSILRQIRSGYANRPAAFPQCIILCGVRDVRDYRIVLSNQDIITGGSAFNIKAKSLQLGNFSKEEIYELYMQHTRETGQVFDEACFPMVWDATEGQPWLVNALGAEVTWNIRENRDRSVRIIPEMIDKAIENIIYRRDTHIDILIDKLLEPRVRRVIQPILANEDEINADAWIERFDYAEAGPQLLLQAFLQRIVNGGGYIDREYGLGRKRTDLLIRKPLSDHYGGPVQRVVLELKIKRGNFDKVIEEGLNQTAGYMDLVGSVDEGHLIVFDRTQEKTWDERIWHKPYEYDGRTIMVWGM